MPALRDVARTPKSRFPRDGCRAHAAPTSAAALRGWVHIAEQPGSNSGDAGEELRLGPLGLAILGREPGDTVELRAVKSTVS